MYLYEGSPQLSLTKDFNKCNINHINIYNGLWRKRVIGLILYIAEGTVLPGICVSCLLN